MTSIRAWPLLTTLLALMPCTALQAQTPYPSRPITIVVPFAAGGPNDVLARLVADHMKGTLGQPILIENIAGAGGTTGSARVAQAEPDGYTLVSGHVGTHAAAPALYPKLRYDPVADFTPVGVVAETPIVLTTQARLPTPTLQDFIALAKERGPALTSGHAGVGSIGHISCLMLGAVIGIKPAEVPYRGSAPALTDLIAGQYDFGCALFADILPHLQSDRLRFLVVSAPQRVAQLPQTPTAAEAGIPDFKASSWFAFFLPKGAAPAIRDRLAEALLKAQSDPVLAQKLESVGLLLPHADGRGPEALRRRVAVETQRWSAIIGQAKIKLE